MKLANQILMFAFFLFFEYCGRLGRLRRGLWSLTKRVWHHWKLLIILLLSVTQMKQQQNIWVNREQLREQNHYELCCKSSCWSVYYLSDIDQLLNVYVYITDAWSTWFSLCIKRADLPRLSQAVISYQQWWVITPLSLPLVLYEG